jgi:hypothetical protein
MTDRNTPRLLARELGEEAFDRVELVKSERPVHSAEQPTDPKRNERHGTVLGFYDSAKPLVNGSSGVARGVGSLPVEVLAAPCRLIEISWICAARALFRMPSNQTSAAVHIRSFRDG